MARRTKISRPPFAGVSTSGNLCRLLISFFLATQALLPVKAFNALPIISPTKLYNGIPHISGTKKVAVSLRPVHSRIGSIFQLKLAKDGGDGGDGGDIVDPNPGGMSNFNNNGKGDDEEDEGFFGEIQNWIKSGEAKEDAKTYTISLLVALVLRFFIIEPRYIPSLSMYPTFDVGDQLAVEKVTKKIRSYSKKEVVVFNPPPAFQEIVTSSKGKEALIKRIVATAGDLVEVKNGKLYINDIKQDEPFTNEDAQYDFGPVEVPPGQLLVLGDNRNHSLDGHIWGFLPTENVIGRAVFIYWPPWRIGNDGMY